LSGRTVAVSVGPDAYAKLSEAAGTPLARFARSVRRPSRPVPCET
jgi:hypothetical protein